MEPRDRLVRRLGAGDPTVGRGLYRDLLWEMVERYETRRDFHFLASRERKQWRSEGKENVPPRGMASAARRGSPLPVWHPRTPLRDVTAVVNAVERRRAALRLAARQRRISGQSSSPIALTGSSSAMVSRTASVKPGSSTPLTVVGKPGPSTPLTLLGVPVDFVNSPRTPHVATLNHLAQVELEMKLEKSIEVLEKAVKENLKRTPKMKNDVRATRLKTLKSMR